VLREFPEYEAEMFAVAKERDLRNQEALRKVRIPVQ
jgi:hypothetical protein